MAARLDPWPIYSWALAPARDVETEEVMIEGLARHVELAGVSVTRVSTSFRPLDPNVWARNVSWREGVVSATNRSFDVRLQNDYVGSPVEHVHRSGLELREQLDASRPSKYALLNDLAKQGTTDYLIQPITISEHIRTFIAYSCNAVGGFTEAQLALLAAIHPAVAALIRLRSTRLTVDSLTRTYLGASAARRVLEGDVERGAGQRIEAVIWFCDLRDYTKLSESLPPETVLQILDAYFETMADSIYAHGGDILKFVGDAMLGIFAPADRGIAGACANAVEAAALAIERFAQVATRGRDEWGVDLAVGIGLHVGDAFYGNIGAHDRLDFTVIGPAVNLAARVQGQCTIETPLLVTKPIADVVERADWHSVGARPLKNIASPPELFTLARFAALR